MTSESLEEACERTGGSGSVGPGNLGREDNAMSVAGRRVPGRGSLLSVPVGDWDLRVPGLQVPPPARGLGVPHDPAPGNDLRLFTCSADTAALPSGSSCTAASFST